MATGEENAPGGSTSTGEAMDFTVKLEAASSSKGLASFLTSVLTSSLASKSIGKAR